MSDLDRLDLGKKVGSGGQGSIHDLVGDPRAVVKIFHQSLPAAESEFLHLVDSGDRVRAVLPGRDIETMWPSTAVTSRGTLAGYVMPRIPDDYFFTTTSLGRKKRLPRLMAHAVPRRRAVRRPVEPPSDLERVDLLRLVATLMDVMHDQDLVYGDVSWNNFAYSLDPYPRIAAFDFDSTRVVGRPSYTRKPAGDTIDWDDPLVPQGTRVATMDNDRYKLGLLAFRMLISHDFHSRPEPDVVVAPTTGLTPRQARMVQGLLRRSAGASGTRPQAAEWLGALAP